jgi:hypothetical protein
MSVRAVMVIASLGLVLPAAAEPLKPEEAKHFVAGKFFAYTCFEGTSGAGRIYADGSVVGTIQIHGTGPTRFVTLPPGTVKVSPDSVCASVRGIPFEPCFNVEKTSNTSFRGSISGLGFAYCDFNRRNPRIELTGTTPRSRVRSAVATSVRE